MNRRIDDRRAGTVGTLIGQACFSLDEKGLLYEETGQLVLPGQAPLMAQQSYLWRALDRGVAVFFSDGRAFHCFAFDNSQAHHDCPPDTYTVEYDFADHDAWTSNWFVTGPRKHYAMSTKYLRVALSK